jgi:BirA family biotin operon repressor/biotin-[acetyl-CoA-carboxylase] ligase
LDRLQYAVVGVGVNVNAQAVDFPPELRERAGSLAMALGHQVDRIGFFRRLLVRLEEAQGWLQGGQGSRVLREWRARASVLGRQVRIVQGDRTLFGQALDVDSHGALLVRNDVGITERVTAGDVETLRMAEPKGQKTGKKPRRL